MDVLNHGGATCASYEAPSAEEVAQDAAYKEALVKALLGALKAVPESPR